MSSIITPPGRLAFVHLFKPWGGPKGDQDPKYMTNLIMRGPALKSPEWAALRKEVVETAKAKFGDDVDLNSIRLPFKKGEDFSDKYKGFEKGDVIIVPRSTEKPGIIDSTGQEIFAVEDVYAGCWGRLSVRAYAYSHSGNRGVGLGLEHVQKLRDDDRLDGRISAAAAFGDSLPDGFEAIPREVDAVADEIPF